MTHKQRNRTSAVQLNRSTTRRHRLPLCEVTGLPRYRNRHQARQGAEAQRSHTSTGGFLGFACSTCNGYHLEQRRSYPLATVAPPIEASPTRPHRYVLVDIENLTDGARDSAAEVAKLWSRIADETLQLASTDHVVVGANRFVYRKYASAIGGTQVRWVIGDASPDAADRALLAAIDLPREASRGSELFILSGDSAFTGLVERAKEAGLRVHVAAQWRRDRGAGLSRKLAAAADVSTVMYPKSSQLRPYPREALDKLGRQQNSLASDTRESEGR